MIICQIKQHGIIQYIKGIQGYLYIITQLLTIMEKIRAIIAFHNPRKYCSFITSFIKNYPEIKDKTDLCTYYRKANSYFTPLFFILMCSFFVMEFLCVLYYIFDPYLRSTLPGLSFAWLIINGVLMASTFYCAIETSYKSKKRDLDWQETTNKKFQVLVLLPTITFMLLPLVVPYMGGEGDMAAFCWLVFYIVQINMCTWLANSVIYKLFLLTLFNTGYCLLCIYNNYFIAHNFTRFTSPIILGGVFLIRFDKYAKENFLLKSTLKQQKKMYEKHLEKVQDPVVILDSSQILFANQASQKNTGDRLEDFYEDAKTIVSEAGETLENQVKDAFSRSDRDQKERVRQDKYNTQSKRPNEKIHNKTLYVTLIESFSFPNKKIVSLTLHDVTQELLKEEARVEGKYKNMLLFSLSHELRNPLNTFQLFLGISKSWMKTKELVNVRRDAKGAWRYLRNKISDILDYAQILTGEFTLHRIRFSLRRLVKQLKKMTYCLLEYKRETIQLSFEVSEDINDDFVEDLERLEQVLFNFLSNAVKYTTKGMISLAVYPRPGDNKKVRFEVKDTGCGMSSEATKALFELRSSHDYLPDPAGRKFKRKSTGLSGLGLTISKLICNRMGSDILVTSVLGEGSSFAFDVALPADLHIAENLLSESFVVEDYSTPNKCRVMEIKGGMKKEEHDTNMARDKAVVLVVDDNTVNRSVVKSMVAKFGLQVEEADNGKVAIDKLDILQSEFKEGKLIVIMDVEMPVMDGIEATIEIRERDKRPRPHIIALTAFASEEERGKCMEAGMDGFISKPLTKQALSKVLDDLHVLCQVFITHIGCIMHCYNSVQE
eukprot:TRINITY_DN2393_c0_g1_i1.p1 TRINITY_DN2393_c0_g1~~TRINITY_DN2393_c0_g1_i1.p1  ORF type:complete len:830 (+),score=74.83 TRINITY_DN2393_c0_g1_i1:5597-8086(+)